MPISLLIIALLFACFRRILRWFFAPSRLRRAYKRPSSVGKCHFHSSQKPEWLKHEIVRLKALMPDAGCRAIADICNRRFAATRKVTVGKTFVHQTLQRHDYEIQVLRRKLKHAKPINVPCNLIWGVDLTGKTDGQGVFIRCSAFWITAAAPCCTCKHCRTKPPVRCLLACTKSFTPTANRSLSEPTTKPFSPRANFVLD